MKKFLMVGSLCFLLSACATGYHPVGFFGDGYDEFQLTKDSYIVNFIGNDSTSGKRTYRFAMRRAAELTKAKGYKYFIIKKYTYDDADRTTYIAPLKANSNSDYNLSGSVGSANRNTTVTGGEVISINKPVVRLVIKMSQSDEKGALDADIILSNFN